MKFNTSVGLKKRYTKELTGLLGVDLSSAPHAVSPARASEMRNLIPENGVNHKRHGWKELFDGDEKINGIFPFDEGGTEVLLVHAGTAIYRAVEEKKDVWSKTKVSGNIALTDTRSQCFYQGGKAFLVGCGTYLVYGKHGEDAAYTLKPVSEIAYVPTTSICTSAEYGGEDSPSLVTYEPVNGLTSKRKNRINFHENATNVNAKLDGVPNKDKGISITLYDKNGNTKKVGPILPGKSATLSFSGYHYDTISYTVTLSYDRGFKMQLNTGSVGGLGKGDEYMIVDFEVNSNQQTRFNACRFGTLFGVDGASDRLFLSGNPSERNKDYFSEAGDFTYFPDGNVLTVGDSASAVTGYARLSDSTLAIFKGEAMGSPSIFYRTGKEITVKDYEGHDVPAPLFPTLPGTASEYLLGAHAVANLSGDVLMLSRNGVYGIELSENIASTERYARERSHAIYADLKKCDLSDAACTVFRDRYYLALGDKDGTCYVADARYRASFAGARDTGYEWWVWDHVPARCFAIYNGDLLFGTNDGRVCAFDDGYCDRAFTVLGDGYVSKSGERIVFYRELGLKKGDRVTFNKALYAPVVSCTAEGDKVTFAERDLERLLKLVNIGDTVRIAFGEGTTGVKDCRVDDIDPGNRCICVSAGDTLLDLNGACQVLLPLQKRECVIDKVDDSYATLASISGEPLSLVGNDVALTGLYTHYTPVAASWCSPVLDLGSNMHAKTLLGITTALDPATMGELTVFYETRREAAGFAARGPVLLDFDRLDFNAFSFHQMRFSSSFTKRLTVRNFNYIRVGFRHTDECDCAVNGISLYYKINQMHKGVL